MTPRSQVRASATGAALPRRASAPAPERRTRRSRRSQTQVRPAAPPRPRRRRRLSVWQILSWRAVSGVMVVGLSAVLYLFLTSPAFSVSSVAIGGEKYLSREEIFRDANVAKQHVFWIDPKDVAARLKTVPNIADATVLVGWPPDIVQIVIVEREPALTWEQQIRVWVDVNGIVMKQREDRADLLRIVVPNATEPIGVGDRIPQNIIDGALQLRNRYPAIDVLLYDSMKGLGYHDGRGWTVWFGTGESIDTKLLVYNRLVESIYPAVQPGEIIMTDPDRPYYTVLWRNDNNS